MVNLKLHQADGDQIHGLRWSMFVRSRERYSIPRLSIPASTSSRTLFLTRTAYIPRTFPAVRRLEHSPATGSAFHSWGNGFYGSFQRF